MKHTQEWNTFFTIEKNITCDTHLHQTIELARAARPAAMARRRISVRVMILKQFRFFAPKIWLLQGMVLAALCALFLQFHGMQSISGIIRIPWMQRNICRFLCLCSGVIVMSAIPLLARSSKYRMLELEQSTYFSVRGNLLAPLLFIGIGDLGMLSVLALAAERLNLTGNAIFLSMIIPYLTAAVFCLMLWVRMKQPLFNSIGALFSIAAACLIYLIVEQSMIFLPDHAIYCWIIYASLCAGILYRECRNLHRKGTAENMLS